MSDPRDLYIADVVKDRTFADVGGLWGVVNEKVSVAHAGGATALAMIDRVSPGNPLWEAFDAHRRELGVPDVRCLSGDVEELADGMPDLAFDVVHCAGVLYHAAEPMRLLRALRRITRRHLVLSTSVTATRIENEHGVLEIPRASALFVPALRDHEREIVRAHWRQFVGDNAIGLTCDLDTWRPDDSVPWWWLFTVDALAATCMAAGFRPDAGTHMWNDNAYTQLLRVD